ncbi:MAG: endolytic transglycosylase MltG [Burkholderiaceae bacterium]|nr:endolytic transglycosylase MltG [Burkholderiaceae bacterium]
MKRIGILVAVALALLTFCFVYWAGNAISLSGTPFLVEIKPGSLASVIRQINQQGVSVNAPLFKALVLLSGDGKRLKSGFYEVTAGETPRTLLDKLAKGAFKQEALTIVEGWTFRQMRSAINAHPGLRHDTKDMTDAALIEKLGIDAKSGEGLFFPSTYLFGWGSSDMQIYRQAHKEMRSRLDARWNARAPGLPYKEPYEALVMASIVEKETGQPADRGKVSAVFVNRLRQGMRLQTDPTVIYGMGENFDGNIRKKDLLTDTPYNTYTRGGLPPTPIALPGEASIKAALNPDDTRALYFVARWDGSSEFSETLSDHNRAVDKYQRRRP